MDKPKKKKSVFKIVSDVLFALFAVFMVIVVIMSIVQKYTGRSITGKRVVWIMTESMEPTIPQQSYILLRDSNGEDVNIGDVIMFVSKQEEIKGQYNTHRVVGIEPNGDFITKGDNNLYADEPRVNKSEVVAIYERNLPFFTFVGRLFASPAGFAVVATLIAGLVGAWFAIDIHEKKKEAKKELMEEMVQEEVKRLEEEAKKQNIKK